MSADRTLKQWDVATGRCIQTLGGHGTSIYDVAVAPDGRTVLTGGAAGELSIWDLKSPTPIKTVKINLGTVGSVAFSPGCQTALSADGDGLVGYWDIPTLELRKGLRGHISRAFAVAPSPDGKFAASGGEDQTLKLWDLGTGKEVHSSNYGGTVETALFTDQGRTLIASTGGKGVQVWAMGRPARYRELQPRVDAARKILQSSPNDAAALATLGEWYAFRGVNDWAADLLVQARTAGAVVSPLTLARCYTALKKPVEAKAEFERAWQLSEDPSEKRYLQSCIDAFGNIDRPINP